MNDIGVGSVQAEAPLLGEAALRKALAELAPIAPRTAARQGRTTVGAVLWALADELVAKRIDVGNKRLSAWNGRVEAICPSSISLRNLAGKRR